MKSSSREDLLSKQANFAWSEIDLPILSRFERYVQKFPGKTAIVESVQDISYEELNSRANHLANLILAEPGNKPVGILVNHDIESVISILAVIKSGRPFVPLDIAHPLKRMQEIITDAGIEVLLCSLGQKVVGEQLTDLVHCRLLTTSLDMSAENLVVETESNEPACIVYTSGTTGSPKGVCHSRRGILHSVMRSTNSLQITPDDRWLLLVNPAHMGGINGILRVLLNGATLYLYSLLRNSLPALRVYLNEQAITVFHAVPTVYRLFVKSQAGRAEFPALRMFLIGGEALFANDVKLFQACFKAPCKLVNHLGCTEFSGYAEYVVDQNTTLDDGVVPVGFAAEGMEISIVDDHGRVVEPGQVGNIEICSEFLAMGYWQDPDLTRSRFRTVISKSTQKRSYQPGDIGKMRPDGCLVFLGRDDSQVHIRGNRVELIEIEQALRKFSQIEDARVVASRRSNDELTLTAYVTLQVERVADGNEIKHYLGQILPDYMIPNDIVYLDEFPLNANGKVDYTMLLKAD